MKTKLLPILIGLLIFNVSLGQDQEKYREFTKEAFELYQSKDFKKSAEKYQAAFDELGGKAYPRDRYNAACCFALTGDVENAFLHLFKLAESPKIKYRKYDHIIKDTELESLHKDERWNKLTEIVKSNKEEAEKYLDKSLVATLKSVREEHLKNQHLIPQIEEFEKKNGKGSEEMKPHWASIHEKDSVNLMKVKEILDEKGWLGAKIVGEQGNQTLFIIIQNADLPTRVKYLPMMREAVKKGNASNGNLAQLEDGVALKQGHRQVYGSQVKKDGETGAYYVLPITDPENVDKRRSEIGLGTLADYVKRWAITWDIEKHKEWTKKLEAEKEK